MAKREQTLLIRRGVKIWNRWRKDNPLINPDLSFCVLDGTNLMRADLSRASLYCAHLEGAELAGANFAEADLCGASLSHANIRGADFSGSLYLTQTQINEAVGNRATLLPPGLERPRHWGNTPPRPSKSLKKVVLR
jgi:hypothetical protein